MKKTRLLERFLRYVKTWTESNSENADKGIQPSSPMQADFAKELESELKSLGITDIQNILMFVLEFLHQRDMKIVLQLDF